MTTLFLMSVDTACEVFDAFMMAEALSEEERIQVLVKFVDSGKVKCLDTSLSKEQVLKELQEHLKAVYISHNPRGGN